jgi:CheY-like chemotaxis protein
MSDKDAVELRSHRVLSIEDEVDTISEVSGAIRDYGLVVVDADRLEVARERILEQEYDLLIVDSRMQDEGRLVARGGVTFLRDLKEHRLGAMNVDAPFVILTAYVHEVDQSLLVDLPGYRGLLSKMNSGVLQDMSHCTGWELIKGNGRSRNSYRMDDLLVATGPPDSRNRLRLYVPAWDGGEWIEVQFASLPSEIRQEISFGDYPCYVWAEVNLAARDQSEVRPSNYRLCIRDPEEGQHFERGTGRDSEE